MSNFQIENDYEEIKEAARDRGWRVPGIFVDDDVACLWMAYWLEMKKYENMLNSGSLPDDVPRPPLHSGHNRMSMWKGSPLAKRKVPRENTPVNKAYRLLYGWLQCIKQQNKCIKRRNKLIKRLRAQLAELKTENADLKAVKSELLNGIALDGHNHTELGEKFKHSAVALATARQEFARVTGENSRLQGVVNNLLDGGKG